MANKKAAPKDCRINTRLTREERFILDELAKQKGKGPSELARLYILQGIGTERSALETAGTVLPTYRPK